MVRQEKPKKPSVYQKEPASTSENITVKDDRTEVFERFCLSLPGSAWILGKASEIISQIEGVEDFELKKMSAKAALDIAKSDPKRFKKARKTGKQWAIALVTC